MPSGPNDRRSSGVVGCFKAFVAWLRALWLPNTGLGATTRLTFGTDYQETSSIVHGLQNVEAWLLDLRTKSPKLATLVPNFELELRRATPQFKQIIRCLLEFLDSKLSDSKGDPNIWYDPNLLFEKVSEESGMCLLGPEVRAALQPDHKADCCYQGPKSGYPSEDVLCRVVALEDIKRFNLKLTDSYSLLSDEDLMRSLDAIPRVGELRGSRPFNWVARKDELENEIKKFEEPKKVRNRGQWTEQDRATRVRDVLGLDKHAGQDYLVLITFPENIRLEKQARSSVWEGACAPFRPWSSRIPNASRRQNVTVDLSQAPDIVAGLEESCCCPVMFTEEFQVEPFMERPGPLNLQKLYVMFQRWWA